MQIVADQPHTPTALRTDLGEIFVSLELSRSIWLITLLSPGGGERMSKHSLRGGDVAGLLERFAQIQAKTLREMGYFILGWVLGPGVPNEFTPAIFPSSVRSGPPELPGLIGATTRIRWFKNDGDFSLAAECEERNR